MEKEKALKLIADWGYYVLPKAHAESPGYTGLLVAIRKQPTYKHFDPERLHLRLRDAKGKVKWRTSSWRFPIEGPGYVCPGPVVLYDRDDRQVEFFTFGGEMDVFSGPDEFVYLIQSPAPILELTSLEGSVPDQLAYETEVLMAGIEEKWDEKMDEATEAHFEQQLAKADPTSFYLAALHSILKRYEQASDLCEASVALCEALEREKSWLAEQGTWRDSSLSLEELLLQE